MGSQAFTNTIESTFATAWGSTTPIKSDNVPLQSEPTSAYVAIEVWDGKSNKASVGNGVQLRRTLGTVFVMVFTPNNLGSKAGRTYADSIKAIFRDLVVSNVTFYEGNVARLGEKYYTNSGTGVPATSKWFQMAVSIPFKYDEYI